MHSLCQCIGGVEKSAFRWGAGRRQQARQARTAPGKLLQSFRCKRTAGSSTTQDRSPCERSCSARNDSVT